MTGMNCDGFPQADKRNSPEAPSLPDSVNSSYQRKALVVNRVPLRGYTCVLAATEECWKHPLCEGDGFSCDEEHVDPLEGRGCQKSIFIKGIPHRAVQVFIRFLYSSCYEQKEMNKYGLHLLVLSHAFVAPQLKKECEWQLEHNFLTKENVVDIFQLSLLCDAPRLSLFCRRLILKSFKVVSATEGWRVMKQSHPRLEKELLDSVVKADLKKQERTRRLPERKIYLQLYEAMEALVHICKDGCRTIGPHDKVLKGDQGLCSFEACRGLELLIRHFAGCKTRVPGGCIHCKRMWQVLKLHSSLCAKPDVCRVPLCRKFKERSQQQTRKDNMKWKILAKKILNAKSISGAPFFSLTNAVSA